MIAQAILYRYPGASFADFDLLETEDGVQITRWAVTANGEPVEPPNIAELQAWLADAENNRRAEGMRTSKLKSGELLTYLGLADDPQLPGGTRLVLNMTRDLGGAPGYPIIVPHAGLYEVELSLYAYSGSTTTVEAALEVERADGAKERRIIGEQFFYSRIPYRQRALFELERGDALKSSIYWSSASYPKRIVGDWSRLKVSSMDYPLSTLLVRKAA